MKHHAVSKENYGAQSVGPWTPNLALEEMRSLCQVLLFHPCFHRGVKKPHVLPYELAQLDDLDRLVNELAIITEIVFLHPDHAIGHCETYATLLAQVTVTLSAPEAEPKLLHWIEVAGSTRYREDLTRLRQLIAMGHADWKRARRERAVHDRPISTWIVPGHGRSLVPTIPACHPAASLDHALSA